MHTPRVYATFVVLVGQVARSVRFFYLCMHTLYTHTGAQIKKATRREKGKRTRGKGEERGASARRRTANARAREGRRCSDDDDR
jgi:hypothetical protein